MTKKNLNKLCLNIQQNLKKRYKLKYSLFSFKTVSQKKYAFTYWYDAAWAIKLPTIDLSNLSDSTFSFYRNDIAAQIVMKMLERYKSNNINFICDRIVFNCDID